MHRPLKFQPQNRLKQTVAAWIVDAGGLWALALATALAPYLVVRGWVNAAVLLLFFAAAWNLWRGGGLDALRAEPGLRWLCLALAIPFAMVALVQVAHGQATARPFDAPLRLLLSAWVLVWLYVRRVNWIDAAGVAFALASIASAALIYAPGAERFYWGDNRAANYFVDPLSLAQHSMMLGFLCLFSLQREDGWGLRLLKLAGAAAGVSVAISTGSRTGWTMVPILGLLWIWSRPWMKGLGRRSLGLAVLVTMIGAGVWMSSTVQHRLGELANDVRLYASGEFVDSSVGIRLSLFRVAWAAFLAKPLVGWGFTSPPTPAGLPETAALWTPVMSGFFVGAGTHNEWLQALMKMGLAGAVSRASMYLVPLVLFVHAVRAGDSVRRRAGYLGLVVVIAYLAAGMSSEVSNLIYLSSTYGLLMAGLGAMALPPPGSKP